MLRRREGQAAVVDNAHTSSATSSKEPQITATTSGSRLLAAFDVQENFAHLFSPPPPTPSTFPALTGYRALLCIWIVSWHSLFFQYYFVPDADHRALTHHPLLSLTVLGYIPVDAFLLLTGLLISYPLITTEAKTIKQYQQNIDNNNNNNNISLSFSLASFYARRFARALPCFFLTLFCYCVIFAPKEFFQMKYVRAEAFKAFFVLFAGQTNTTYTQGMDVSEYTLSCHCDDPIWLLPQLFHLQHILPFGGIIGWTWSFAVQCQYYLFAAAIWKLVHRQVNLYNIIHNIEKRPSQRLLLLCYILLIMWYLARFITFFQLKHFALQHGEAVFLGFFWYSNTLTRMGPLIAGTLLAYDIVYPSVWVERLRRSLFVRFVLYALIVVVILSVLLWNRVFGFGHYMEAPGYTAIGLAQRLDPTGTQQNWPPTLDQLAHASSYAHHLFYHTTVVAGSPLSTLCFLFVTDSLVRPADPFARSVVQLLSHSAWYPLAVLSWLNIFISSDCSDQVL